MSSSSESSVTGEASVACHDWPATPTSGVDHAVAVEPSIALDASVVIAPGK